MRPRRTEITEIAKSELEALSHHLLASAGTDGLAFLEELEQAIQSIAEFPERFAIAGRLSEWTVRRRVCGPYLIFYVVEPERVVVLRILHGAQDYEAVLFGKN